MVERYAERERPGRVGTSLFYYAFGLFKIAVIAQQIYYRYKQGLTKDERFAAHDRRACGCWADGGAGDRARAGLGRGTIPAMPSELTALLRFHLHVGARLAMRVLMPVLVAAVGGVTLLGEDFLRSFSVLLWGPGSTGGSGVLIAAACYGVAAGAAPRVCRGLDGWLRHLPIHGVAQRRAAGLAIAVSLTPLLLGFTALSLVATKIGRATCLDVLSLGVCAMAAALLAMPVERPWLARPLALASSVVAVSGGWPLLVAGGVLLIGADLAAGALPRDKRASLAGRGTRRAIGPWTGRLRRAADHLAGVALAGALGGRLRAPPARLRVGVRGPQRAGAAARAAGGPAGRRLRGRLRLRRPRRGAGDRRPAWPWSRSLPWSARRRVRFDAGFLAAHALPRSS